MSQKATTNKLTELESKLRHVIINKIQGTFSEPYFSTNGLINGEEYIVCITPTTNSNPLDVRLCNSMDFNDVSQHIIRDLPVVAGTEYSSKFTFRGEPWLRAAIDGKYDNFSIIVYGNIIREFQYLHKNTKEVISDIGKTVESNSEKIYELAESVNSVDIDIKKGYYVDRSNGLLYPFDTSEYTDFLPILPLISYFYFGRQINDVCCWAFYDANKRFISSSETEEPNIFNGKKVTDIPSNAKYIRFSSFAGSSSEYSLRVCVSSINTNTTKWIGKKWCCVGDSQTERNIRATKRYYDYISDATGIEFINRGISGTGYKAEEEYNRAFYQRIGTIPTDVDVVTIMGSGNDRNLPLGNIEDTTTTTVCGCINTTIQNYYDVFLSDGKIPAPLGIITPIPYGDKMGKDDDHSIENVTNALTEIAKRWSIPCLDLFHACNLNPSDERFRDLCYTHDAEYTGVHPDEIGHKFLAPKIKSFLETLVFL